jgi:translation initiation factor 2B subunit (eIF-2B alpha/beta/delta family)
MSLSEENELLLSLAQQSDLLRRTLDNLNGIWSDEASRTLYSRHLSSQLAHDEDMLQALKTQSELHMQGDESIDAANQHMAEAGMAHRHLEGHLLYAQQQMGEAERKHQESLSLQQEVRDNLQKIQQSIQEARRAEYT